MGDVVVLSSSATRHSCKVCRKGFPCGRSLGGHMRSHSLAEMETAVGNDDGEEQQKQLLRSSDCAGAGGYGLRENPKKTQRLSGLDDGRDDCGVEVERDQQQEEEEEDKVLVPTEPGAGVMPAPRRRRRSMRVPAPAPPAAFDNDDAEDVARCLVMLSRDIIHRRDSKDHHSPPKHTRRRQQHYYHNDADSDDAYALTQYTDADVGVSKRKASRGLAGDEKRGRYECPGCGRAFQSYQALGGHRASHKRINSNCSIVKATPELQPEPSIDTNASLSMASSDAEFVANMASTAVVALKAKPQKPVKFECPICFKVFGSGQALGGHKRSHSIAGELCDRAHADGDAAMDDTELQPLVDDGFFDLNLPAPGAED